MRIGLDFPAYSISADYVNMVKIDEGNKEFPIIFLGRDSYVMPSHVDSMIDEKKIYNLHIGRYSSIASETKFIINMNHDYKRPCQGIITGAGEKDENHIKRKGQIVIMNDCWIGENTTIMGGVIISNGAIVAAGSVVTKDVPPYAVVAGSPAKIIGYRFSQDQIDKLLMIRWWNWSAERVLKASSDLFGNIDVFIDKYIDEAVRDIENIQEIDINYIDKVNIGEEQRLLYIPDFEQDFPTYPKVIDAFARSYNNTNVELLLYVKKDDFVENKIQELEKIFEKYEDVNCYVNLFVGDLADERGLFAHADAYISNRSLENVRYMDIAEFYNIPVISSVDTPVFSEIDVERMIRS